MAQILSIQIIHLFSLVLLCTLQFSSQQLQQQKPRRKLDDCSNRYREYALAHNGQHFGSAGTPTRIKEFAHMAAIGWTDGNGMAKFSCGGSLISLSFVLTAAHCTSSDSVPPDVVRLGDINLYNAEDDKYAQQFKIAEIIRHPAHRFSARYNDIALLRLDGVAVVTGPVCPACLYTGRDIPFEQMEATGWGDTGFGQSKSDILLKFRLAPTPLNNCSIYYPPDHNLRNGLDEQQMLCAFDTKMDTCSGDSGGPLGVKLIAGNLEVPYIIGITSFGLACGFGSPGVYTKVSTYIPWIESVVGANYDIKSCALQYLKYRESIDFSTNPPVRLNWNNKYNNHVYLQWPGSQDVRCLGTLISEDYVLTSASCLANREQPIAAEVGNLNYIQSLAIKRVVTHPGFSTTTLANNIALLQLERAVGLSKEIFPACVWTKKDIAQLWLKVFATGPENFYILENINETKPVGIELFLNIDKSNQCMSVGQSSQTFCAGKTFSAVPNICDITSGSPLENGIPVDERVFNFVFGIYSHGADCGYGKSVTFTRLSAYVSWMEDVMFNVKDSKDEGVNKEPPIANENDSITFVNDHMQTCKTNSGASGTCLQRYDCPPRRSQFAIHKFQRAEVDYCENGMVCCVTQNLI